MSIVTTKAYKAHSQSIQDAFNFSVTVCFGMRTLENHLNEVDAGRTALVQPYHYAASTNTPAQLRTWSNTFETQLSKHLLLAVFSYFESFVVDLVEEFVEFQSGYNAMITRAKRIDKAYINKELPKELYGELAKLRVAFQKNRLDRYRVATRHLQREGFVFPTQTFSAYGIRRMKEELEKLRAFAIPNFLVDAFHVPLDPADIKKYHDYRILRNKVAHGDHVTLSLRQISEMNTMFGTWTSLINKHFCEHYFVIEKFV